MPLPPQKIFSVGDETLPSPHRVHLRQLALQFSAALTVFSLAWPFSIIRNAPLPWAETTLTIGCVAFFLATLTKQTWWWRLIHTLFAPLAWGINTLSIDPGWFLLALILLLLIYRGALTGQIPLYLSNIETASALTEITSQRPGMLFIDLGAGFGSILGPLSKMRPDSSCTGVENAPVVWLIGYLRTLFLPNCSWRWGSLWNVKLHKFDVVYAFLSPTPMPDLWKKIKSEMKPGSLFISNSFAVPEMTPTNVIEIDDPRQTRLYCYLL